MKFIDFLKGIAIFIIETPSRLQKNNLISGAKLNLEQIEYKYALDNCEKRAKEIREGERLIKAMEKCPPIFLIEEIRRFAVFENNELTEEICESFIDRIELYSN